MRLLLLLLFIPAAGLAGEFTLLKGDQALSMEQVSDLTRNGRLEFYEGGRSRYSVGGAYSYSYKDGGTAFGRFEIRPDGAVCVTFRNGRDRCDRFVRSHGRLVMITQTGDRYPIRPR